MFNDLMALLFLSLIGFALLLRAVGRVAAKDPEKSAKAASILWRAIFRK